MPHDQANQEISLLFDIRDTGVCFEILLGGKTIDQLVKQDMTYTITVHQC